MENEEKVVLEANSKKGDRDWYGDFNYDENPLSHYSNCKMCAVTRYGDNNGHGYGIAKIKVKTTIDFIKMMGWEKDLIYRVKE